MDIQCTIRFEGYYIDFGANEIGVPMVRIMGVRDGHPEAPGRLERFQAMLSSYDFPAGSRVQWIFYVNGERWIPPESQSIDGSHVIYLWTGAEAIEMKFGDTPSIVRHNVRLPLVTYGRRGVFPPEHWGIYSSRMVNGTNPHWTFEDGLESVLKAEASVSPDNTYPF